MYRKGNTDWQLESCQSVAYEGLERRLSLYCMLVRGRVLQGQLTALRRESLGA